MSTLKFEPIEIYYNQLMNAFSGIYIFHNITKNKYYVGQSSNVPKRLNCYLSEQSHNKELSKDLTTDKFELALINILNSTNTFLSLDQTEAYYIQMFNSNNPIFGYNKTVGNSTKPVQLKIGGPTNPNNLFKPIAIAKDQDLVNNLSATVDLYIDFLVDRKITELPYLNLNAEHKRYELWLANNNPSAKPLKVKRFIKELIEKLKKLGYKVFNEGRSDIRVRITSFKNKLLSYNNDVINQATSYEVDINKRLCCTFMVNENNFITDADIEVFDQLVDQDKLDLTDPRMLQILYYKVYKLEDAELAERYKEQLIN